MLYARYGLYDDCLISRNNRILLNAISVNVEWLCYPYSGALNAINRDLSLISFMNPYC